MRHVFAGLASVFFAVGSLCGSSFAETLPPGVAADPTRRPFNILQLIENDLIYSKVNAHVYVMGVERISLPAGKAGKWMLPLESVGLQFNATDLTSVDLRRELKDGTNTVRQEAVEGYVDRSHITFRISKADPRPGRRFLDTLVWDSPWDKYIRPEAHDRIDAKYKTDFATADYLFGLKRADVVNAPWPEAADKMAWLLVGSIAMSSADDNLTRYEVGPLVYFVRQSVVKAPDPKHGDRDRIVFTGQLFDSRKGNWIGTVVVGSEAFGDNANDVTRQDVQKLLSRVMPSD